MRGLRPNVLKRRLNQTTSGFRRCRTRNSRREVSGSSNDQQRSTQKPSSSGRGAGILSARIVRLRNGFRCNSCAMCSPYSLNPPWLGGKLVTKQIFILSWPHSLGVSSMSYGEEMLALALPEKGLARVDQLVCAVVLGPFTHFSAFCGSTARSGADRDNFARTMCLAADSAASTVNGSMTTIS